MSAPRQILRARAGDGDSSELLAPSVGIFVPRVDEGELVSAGQSVGALDVLGVREELVVPDGVAGRVTARIGGKRTRVPVQYGDALLVISTASVADATAVGPSQPVAKEGVLAFVAPMSGRFYSRPSPTEPAFVSAGDSVQRGQTIGLLEVMKTFNRLVYEGDALPETATIERIVPADGDDVVRGDMVLSLRSPDEE